MKKRILTIALIVALVATCFAGTFAYLTDSDSQTNTFTVGKVYITLDEAKVVREEATGNLVQDGENRTDADQEYHPLLPATTVVKDPTITVVDGSSNAWIAAKVTVTGNLSGLVNDYGLALVENGEFNPAALISGGLLDDEENRTIVQVPGADGKSWTLYIYVKDQKAAGEKIVLFEQLNIPAKWDNPEMEQVNGMKIQVEAYAVQAAGFADCETAMKTAFEAAFPANP